MPPNVPTPRGYLPCGCASGGQSSRAPRVAAPGRLTAEALKHLKTCLPSPAATDVNTCLHACHTGTGVFAPSCSDSRGLAYIRLPVPREIFGARFVARSAIRGRGGRRCTSSADHVVARSVKRGLWRTSRTSLVPPMSVAHFTDTRPYRGGHVRESLLHLSDASGSTAWLCGAESLRSVLILFPDETDASSVGTLNAVRDARRRLRTVSPNEYGARNDDSRSASRSAVAALNRMQAGPRDAETSLCSQLASASVHCPASVVSCLYDSALRHRRQSKQRRILRRAIAVLGNCATLSSGVRGMSLSEQWLYNRLRSPDATPSHVVAVLEFASQLLEALPCELEPPLGWQACLLVVAPKLMDVTGRQVAGIRLALLCARFADSPLTAWRPGDDRVLDLLLAFARRRRRQAAVNEVLFDEVETGLEQLVAWFAQSPQCDLRRTVSRGDGGSWTVALWLWSRGYGKLADSCLWKGGAMPTTSRAQDGTPAGPMRCLALCECAIVISSICPSATFDSARADTNPPRLREVKAFVESLLIRVKGDGFQADKTTLWVAALARQLAFQTPNEHARFAANFLPYLIKTDALRSLVQPSGERVHALCAAFRMHVRALALLLSAKGGALNLAGGGGQRGLSLHVTDALAVSATSRVTDFGRHCSTQLSRLAATSAGDEEDPSSSYCDMLIALAESGVLDGSDGRTVACPLSAMAVANIAGHISSPHIRAAAIERVQAGVAKDLVADEIGDILLERLRRS
jgi:hypothetical protein